MIQIDMKGWQYTVTRSGATPGKRPTIYMTAAEATRVAREMMADGTPAVIWRQHNGGEWEPLRSMSSTHGNVGSANARKGATNRKQVGLSVDPETLAEIDRDQRPGESRGMVLDRWARDRQNLPGA